MCRFLLLSLAFCLPSCGNQALFENSDRAEVKGPKSDPEPASEADLKTASGEIRGSRTENVSDESKVENDGSAGKGEETEADAADAGEDRMMQNDSTVTDVSEVEVPEEAVKKGSFTVWTVPADPMPFEDYRIMIEVSLPEGTMGYGRADLSGRVTGTDGYLQVISPMSLFQILTIQEDKAVLRLQVPGTHNLVKDTIEVKSNLLMESQTIAIVF